ncbi:ribonuclease HII [Aestuariivirga litoralis]|uniref:ribonuclease HII n=1 Tax=Aestuariivirga litoralis TaxID=2650924 RepID=UPI0018C7AF75|nr:ribonuclease HII [Aestuariivirga litoralis]MBG1233331.1 ribonuclease HII [Aestuariivirga litoralis]
MPKPHFRTEKFAFAEGHVIVCGVDEAGRGPWAGPVYAAAAILDPKRIPKGINDSKALTHERREELYPEIIAVADFGIGFASAAEIDEINILQATYLAMNRAVMALQAVPTLALIDGNRAPKLACKTQTLIGGDAISLSIAAASIIAKVTRDRLMTDLDQLFPHYGFAKHKGYGTADHAQALKTHGPCAEHRKSFAPIRALLA